MDTLSKISLDHLRLDDDIDEIEIEESQKRIALRKPDKQEYFRVHPDKKYRIDALLLYFDQEKRFYFAAPSIQKDVRSELVSVKLVTCINRRGDVFLWPLKISSRQNNWTTSALAGAEAAIENWIRLKPDLNAERYRSLKALSMLDAPEWPDESFENLINRAFQDTQIHSLDHPVIKKLRGEL